MLSTLELPFLIRTISWHLSVSVPVSLPHYLQWLHGPPPYRCAIIYFMSFWVGLCPLFPCHKQQCGNKECTLSKTFIEVQYKYRKHKHTAHKLTTLLEAAPRSWASPEALLSPSIASLHTQGLCLSSGRWNRKWFPPSSVTMYRDIKKTCQPAALLPLEVAYLHMRCWPRQRRRSACVHARFRRFNTKPLSPLQCLQLLNLGFIAYGGSYGKRAYWSGALRSCLRSGHFYGPFFVAKDLWPA